MAHHELDCTTAAGVLKILTENGLDGMASALQILMNEAMKLERSEFLGAAPHERSEERRGHANGFKPKSVNTRAGRLDLDIPQVRSTSEPFYPKSLEKGLRSERALKVAVAEMYVQGVSTRRVKTITESLCGFDVSSTQVSRAAALLDEELAAWRARPIGETPYLVLDARYERVRHGGSVIDCAVLVAVGIGIDGKRRVLGVSVSLSEAEVHWREFLASLKVRGLIGVRLVVSDDHAGLKAARRAELPGVAWQRCQFHVQRNAVAFIPQVSMRTEVARAIRSIFNAGDRASADLLLAKTAAAYRDKAPRLAEWLENAIPEALTILELPEAHHRLLRTVNSLENLNKQIKRRTSVAALFPNEAALLRLVSAVLAEISEEWETSRIYLRMEAE
jgi:transposase-like protein